MNVRVACCVAMALLLSACAGTPGRPEDPLEPTPPRGPFLMPVRTSDRPMAAS